MRRLRARASAAPRELVVLLMIAAVLGLAWAVVLPPLQGPDEVTHVNYAQQIAERGSGPHPDGGKYSVSTEIGTALTLLNLRSTIGVLDARPSWSGIERRRWEAAQPSLTGEARADGLGPSPLARNPQLYYVYVAVPYLAFGWSDLLDRLAAMRLASVLLFVLTVLLTWLLAIEVLGRRAQLGATVATGIVALHPMLAFMAGVINPDIGLVTTYTLVSLLSVRLVRRGPSAGRVLALCLAAAATLLVHGRGLAAVGVTLIALGAAVIRHQPPRRRFAAWTAVGAACAMIPLVVSKLLLAPASGGGLYGGEATLTQFNLRQFLGQTWQFYFDRLSFMQPRLGPDYGYREVVVERFATGVFASLEVEFPEWVYDITQIGLAALFVVTWTLAVANRERLRGAWPVLAVLAAQVLGVMLLLHLASYRALNGGSEDPLITGRYLLPLLPVLALACGWAATALPRALRLAAAGALLTSLLLLQLAALGMTAVRFYV